MAGWLALIGLALGSVYLWQGRAQPTAWDYVDGTGTELVVHFTGSECQTSSRVEAEEHDDRVVITTYEGVRARACSDVGVPYELTVVLEEPLGGRDLVNGVCLTAPRTCPGVLRGRRHADIARVVGGRRAC